MLARLKLNVSIIWTEYGRIPILQSVPLKIILNAIYLILRRISIDFNAIAPLMGMQGRVKKPHIALFTQLMALRVAQRGARTYFKA